MFELGSDVVDQWVTLLADLERDLNDAQRVDLLRSLEELKCAASGAQAVLAADLDASQRTRQEEAGLPARRVGEGIASQVGLARRESPHKAARLLGLAKILDREMPHTLALVRTGRLSEWRATLLARETACLSVADRAEVDRRLCATGQAVELSDRALEREARKLALELDVASVVERARRAEAERHVTIRPVPDTMTILSALLPVKSGVAVYAALKAAADTARAAGDPRSRSQVMADTLTERVTGTSVAAPAQIKLSLVMTDRALFGTSQEPAHLPGYGPVPAPYARDLVLDGLTATDTQVWVRRLFTHPATGTLVAMDSTARHAPAGLADVVGVRDQDLCRTPWCGAPLRVTDHAEEHQSGGETTEANLQGLCERCNLAKQAPGWHARPTTSPFTRHTIETTTPTGHRHRSRAPAPLGHGRDIA